MRLQLGRALPGLEKSVEYFSRTKCGWAATPAAGEAQRLHEKAQEIAKALEASKAETTNPWVRLVVPHAPYTFISIKGSERKE